MVEVALWTGIAGIIVAVFAVIILYLTRKNILDILDKDVILFDRNFELKKRVVTEAFALVDEIEKSSGRVRVNREFVERAKNCYNELLCVMSDVRVVDEFYSLAFEENEITSTRLAQFKIWCRHDIGLNTKKAQAVKRLINKNKDDHEIQKEVKTYSQPASELAREEGLNQNYNINNANLSGAVYNTAQNYNNQNANNQNTIRPTANSATTSPQNNIRQSYTHGAIRTSSGTQTSTGAQNSLSRSSVTSTPAQTGAAVVRRGRPPLNRTTPVPTNSARRTQAVDEDK